MNALRSFLFAFALGAAAALGFAPISLWSLTLVAAALLLGLLDRAVSGRAALALGWGFGFGHYLVGFNWIATAFTYQAAMPAWIGWATMAGVAALMAVYPALAGWGAWRLGRDLPSRILWFATLWMLGEWLRGYLLSGFAWNPLGAVWLPVGGVAQGAGWIGTIGLSGLVWCAAGSLVLLRRRHPVLLVAPAVIAAIVVAQVVRPPLPPATPLRLALVQANIGQGAKYADPNANLARYFAMTQAAFAKGAQVVIWPEGAVQFAVDEDPALRAALAALVPPGGVLLFGADHIERDAAGTAVGARNSLFAADASGLLPGRYDKAHLVPGGEYLPLRKIAEPLGLARLVPGSLDFWEGPGPRTLHLGQLPPMGVQICYEIIFPARVIDAADRPAWLLTVSNDAWFGGDGPPQHFAQARLRAIEEGVPIVRATPTGITGVIDARGGVVAVLPQHVAQVLHAQLPAAQSPTPFARAGHLTTLLFGLLLVALAMLQARRKRDH